MKEHQPSREELRQREKEALSRQKIQEQARREAEQERRKIGQEDARWHEPEMFSTVPLPPEYAEPVSTPPQKRKRKKWLIALCVAVVVLLAALAVHAIFIHAPELPSDTEEQTAPDIMEGGRRDGVYTFLLVGRDDKEGGGGNTDTIMVGCFDTEQGTLDVLSIFRDTLVDVPWEIKKINSVFNVQGIDGLKEQVKNLIGYTPDYYFVMELSAVAEVVDALGGVTYDIPYNMDYDDPTQDLHIHFAKGQQHLNGVDAVKVLRWRKNNSGEALSVGDVGRVELQHTFLKALASQAIRPGNLPKVKEIARIVDKNLTSDLTYGEMLWFGEKALGLQENGIRFHSLPGDYTGTIWSNTYHNYQSYVFVNADALRSMVNQYMNPYHKAITPDRQHVISGTTKNDQPTLPTGGKKNTTAPSAWEDEVAESPTGGQPVTQTPVKPTQPDSEPSAKPSQPQTEPSPEPQEIEPIEQIEPVEPTETQPQAEPQQDPTPEPQQDPTPEPQTPAPAPETTPTETETVIQ